MTVMRIGGLQKLSFIDFPGKISAVIFTQGCNFRCQFCHNASLVIPEQFNNPYSENDIFEFLKKRHGQIDGVVISGGEPTIHQDLKTFIEQIKNIGYSIKLDTNGTNPNVLHGLYSCNLLDYVAMDIKHAFSKYDEIIGTKINIENVKSSIKIIQSSNVPYEFRTTVVPAFHNEQDIITIAQQISGANRLALQEFVPDHAIVQSLTNTNSLFTPENQEKLNNIIEQCKQYVDEIVVRRS